jgi:hypothetical protein
LAAVLVGLTGLAAPTSDDPKVVRPVWFPRCSLDGTQVITANGISDDESAGEEVH